jgi:hypothetical protein
MSRMKMLMLLTALLLSAFQTKPVDLTGVWAGTFSRPDGPQSEVHFDLKQKGEELTGTAGPRLDRQAAIANGKVTIAGDVTSVTFETTQPTGLVLRFALKLVDGRLKGTATAEANGEKREAAIDAGRPKPPQP